MQVEFKLKEKHKAESWIEQNSWKRKYVIGQTRNTHEKYDENIKAVLEKIEAGEVNTRAEAKSLLAKISGNSRGPATALTPVKN